VTRRHALVAAGGVAAALTVIAAFMLTGGSDTSLRADLEAEFAAGGYTSAAAGSGEVIDVDIVAAPTRVDLVSGGDTRVWAYNGSVPGPELRITLGDTLRVTFRNDLSEPTTIHWHGVRVDNAMDGVPGVTQAQVEPGQTFVYEITPPDAGTFWYHSHLNTSEQIERGLHGTLVVEEPTPQPWSQDAVWVVDDWLLDQQTVEIDPDFVTDRDIEHNGREGNLVTVNGSAPYVFEARPGERVRLRLVNTSNGRVYRPSLDGLEAIVIAVDGRMVRDPFALDGFELAPGNRVDLDVTMPSDEGSHEVASDFDDEVFHIATIEVAGELVDTPEFARPSNPALPSWFGAEDAEVDREYVMTIRRPGTRPEWALSEHSFPDVDPFEVIVGSFAKIRFANPSQMFHPMHIHGVFFKVISINGRPVDEGFYRDTVLVKPGDEVDVGLVPADLGTWALHCHILEHADAGMMTLVDVVESN
jgi:FtsP/CotA-like multicopper oxidase with cupredoxin domain